MISEEMYAKVDAALADARQRGVPFAVELDRRGILLTEDKRTEIRAGVLNLLGVIIDRERPESILRWHFGDSGAHTAAEMWAALQHWLEDFITNQMRS